MTLSVALYTNLEVMDDCMPSILSMDVVMSRVCGVTHTQTHRRCCIYGATTFAKVFERSMSTWTRLNERRGTHIHTSHTCDIVSAIADASVLVRIHLLTDH